MILVALACIPCTSCILCIGSLLVTASVPPPVTSPVATEWEFSLADLIAPSTGCAVLRSGTGVSPRSGFAVPFDNFGGSGTTGAKFSATNGAAGKANLPGVDGVFTIDGSSRIDSVGTQFAFPPTGGGYNWDALRDGFAVLDANDILVPIELADQPNVIRDGIGIPGNTGITFDVAKIANSFPGAGVVRVDGVLGITDAVVGSKLALTTIVDGVPKASATLAGPGAYLAFSIPLAAGNRFVTFAAVDLAGTLDFDGGVVADLRLVLGGAFHDCNGNAVPDECDLVLAASNDCDFDGRPDECEWQAIPYGAGFAGGNGLVPQAMLSGCVATHATLYYDILNAHGGGTAFVIVGASKCDVATPFGPHLLVGDATPAVHVVHLAGVGPGKGVVTILGVQPYGLLSWQSLVIQTVVADPLAPKGFSSTPGLELRTYETN